MGFFGYNDYQASETAKSDRPNSGAKVGYFVIKDGDEALVRFNIGSTADFIGAAVHKAVFPNNFAGLPGYGGVSCLRPVGQTAGGDCPFCRAAEHGHSVIKKAEKFIYVEMIVSYKDRTSGVWSAPQAVVWERPWKFSEELLEKIKDFGDLRGNLFKIKRFGSKKDTRYTVEYALPTIYNPDIIPADFSAFVNFDLTRHSFWQKTAEELEMFISAGTFPSVVAPTIPLPPEPVVAQPQYRAPVNPAPVPQPVAQPVQTSYQQPQPSQSAAPWTSGNNTQSSVSSTQFAF